MLENALSQRRNVAMVNKMFFVALTLIFLSRLRFPKSKRSAITTTEIDFKMRINEIGGPRLTS